MRAHLFQLGRPVDVGLLVEARHQLHHHRHFLAGARGGQQGLHQLGILAGAVDGLLDRHHVRIQRGGRQEVDDGLERLVRVVQQPVLLGHGLEELGRLVAYPVERGRHRRAVIGEQQVGPQIRNCTAASGATGSPARARVGVLGRQ